MMDFEYYRLRMVEDQIKKRGITDPRILDAFLSIPRENFMIEENINYAYIDGPFPIGYNQTISQPYVVALMTQLIDPQKDEHICEIGTGSGYQAAILSKLCKKVTSFEIIQELSTFAKTNFKITKLTNIDVICADGTGFQMLKKGPYDKIIVTAATKIKSNNWFNALKEGGVLVLPEEFSLMSQILRKYEKKNDEFRLVEESIPVRFVQLTGGESE